MCVCLCVYVTRNRVDELCSPRDGRDKSTVVAAALPWLPRYKWSSESLILTYNNIIVKKEESIIFRDDGCVLVRQIKKKKKICVIY